MVLVLWLNTQLILQIEKSRGCITALLCDLAERRACHFGATNHVEVQSERVLACKHSII